MKKTYTATIIIIILFATFLRIYCLDFPLSHDEWYTYDIINRHFADMNVQMYNDVHVPLYFYLAKIFSSFLGLSEIKLRIFSVILGIIGIIILTKFSLTYFSKRVALLATSIVSLSVFHILYSQIARMYSLLFLLAITSLYFLFALLFRTKRYSYLGYILSNIALLYTHLFGVFILLFEVVSLYKFREKITDLKKIIVSHLIIILGSIPVGIFTIIQIIRKFDGTSYANWMPQTKWSDIYMTFSALTSNDILTIPFLVLSIYFIFDHFIKKDKRSTIYEMEGILLTGILICFILPITITLITPVFAWRYFFIVYPIFILYICLTLEKIAIKNKAAYLLIIFFVLSLMGLSAIDGLKQEIQNRIEQDLCLTEVKAKIMQYQNQSTVFVTSRWLNEWVKDHRPIVGAHKKLEEILGINTLLINDYNTDLRYLFSDYKYIMNISPSSWADTFINESTLKLNLKGNCYGYSYKVYNKK